MKLSSVLCTLLLTAASGCSAAGPDTGGAGAGNGDPTGGDPGSGTAQAPRFEVLLTDAPAEFDQVWVNVTSAAIGSDQGGWITLTDTPQTFDLLTLQNDATAALGGVSLAPDTYSQVRLIVDDASVVLPGGDSQQVTVASGARTGIKINLDAAVEDNMVYTLTLDFDAGKSIKSTGHGWLMTPVIQVKDFTGAPAPAQGDEPGPDAGPGADEPGGPDAGDAPEWTD